MHENLCFTEVAALAKRLQRKIAIYDLEATTFRGRPNFGITEVACFVVTPDGPGVFFSSLINPERAISVDAQRLTGITPPMVANQPTWGEKYAGLFAKMASGECYVVGYNNATFDNPAVVDMNARYGQPISGFSLSFDVRTLFRKLSNQGTGKASQKGTLAEAAARYGVFPRGALHRAAADVALTVELLNALIEVHGFEEVLPLIDAPHLPVPVQDELLLGQPQAEKEAAMKGTSDVRASTPTPTRYAKSTTSKLPADAIEAAKAFKENPKALSFEVGRAIDERRCPAEVFLDESLSPWLNAALEQLPEDVFSSGKLKPVFEALAAKAPPPGFDYIQLRIGLLHQGRSWSTLRK